MPASKTVSEVVQVTTRALRNFNESFSSDWSFGTNWSNIGNQQFETFINKYLFPKLNETLIIDIALGNRFNFLAKEVDFIGQFSEEYVVLDSVPVTMNLTKDEELMLKRNYPKLITKLYGSGFVKKQKFTLNNNDVRFNFLTLGDATNYAIGVYKKKLSDINVTEESEIKAMLLDYSLNYTKEQRTATDMDDLLDKVFLAIMNLQNNSAKYNESSLASGGAVGRYTTVSALSNIAILTSDTVKAHLLNSKLAHTYQVSGLDLTKKIISFDDLGGVWRAIKDAQIGQQATIDLMRAYGDYQVSIGDWIRKGDVFTYDVSSITSGGQLFEEIKPPSDLYAFIFDVNAVRYARNTKGMLKEPFLNGEFDEVTHWIHYYSRKAISPFFNKITIKGE